MGRLYQSAKDCSFRYYGTSESGRDPKPSTFFQRPRVGFILGTGWSNPDVLKENGFVLEEKIDFSELDLCARSGAGHPNKFLFGTWHGRDVVISQGRFHLYQENSSGHESLIRRWMSHLIYFMNGSKQLVITASVGGLSKRMKEDVLVMPSGIVSAHLPMPYLIGSEGEFVMSEHLLWPGNEYIPTDQFRSPTDTSEFQDTRCKPVSAALAKGWNQISLFATAARESGCYSELSATHYVVPGPGFGGATERRIWARMGCDTVGMSLDPELRLVALENMDNRAKGAVRAYEETDIAVFPALFVSDAHDLPNNDEIQARAKAMTPKLGKFLSYVVQST